jgi:hypothetical protein
MNSGVGRSIVRGIVGIISIVLVSTLLPTGAAFAKSKPVVPRELFGMHYHGVSNSVPNFRVGAVRLWDSGVAWATLQPTPDTFNWGPLDSAVANAQAAGVAEIQYAFGHTPVWAAAQKNKPGPIGNGTASEPANMAYFTNFARAVAERYRGRITSYDMWNEGNLKIYWTGTSKQLADLTIQGSRAIKSVDPAAKVLTPSITYGAFTRRPKFWKDFALRMKKARWPIDAINVHPYSKTPNYLSKRDNTIKKTKAFYRKYGFKGPIWDTEVNYGDRRGLGQGWKQVVYSGDVAAGMIARTYVDSMRNGVYRVFWYGWDSHVLGIDAIDPSSKQITAAGQAFLTVQDWMVGKTWLGCKDKKSIRSCKLQGQDGARSTIVYATSKTRTLTIPNGVGSYQVLSGQVIAVAPGQKVKVNGNPILLIGV